MQFSGVLFKRDVTLLDWPALDLLVSQLKGQGTCNNRKRILKAMHNYLSVFLSDNQLIFDHSSTKQQEQISSDHVNKQEKNLLICISKILISKTFYDESRLGASP